MPKNQEDTDKINPSIVQNALAWVSNGPKNTEAKNIFPTSRNKPAIAFTLALLKLNIL